MAGEKMLAEDAAQQVFIQLWPKIEQYRWYLRLCCKTAQYSKK